MMKNFIKIFINITNWGEDILPPLVYTRARSDNFKLGLPRLPLPVIDCFHAYARIAFSRRIIKKYISLLSLIYTIYYIIILLYAFYTTVLPEYNNLPGRSRRYLYTYILWCTRVYNALKIRWTQWKFVFQIKARIRFLYLNNNNNSIVYCIIFLFFVFNTGIVYNIIIPHRSDRVRYTRHRL